MRILYQLTSPMDKTVGPQEVARRQKVLQSYAAGGVEVAVEPTATFGSVFLISYSASLAFVEPAARTKDMAPIEANKPPKRRMVRG